MMRRPGGRQREHQWVLDYQMPGPAPDRRALRPDRDDDDDDEDEDAELLELPASAQDSMVEQLLGAAAPDPQGEAGVVLIRCHGTDVVAMERLAPGERARPLPGRRVDLSARAAGLCRLSSDEPTALVHLVDRHGAVRVVGSEEARQILCVAPERVLITIGDERLVVRPLAGRGPRRRALVLALVLVAVLVVLVWSGYWPS